MEWYQTEALDKANMKIQEATLKYTLWIAETAKEETHWEHVQENSSGNLEAAQLKEIIKMKGVQIGTTR